MKETIRCGWVVTSDPLNVEYHDKEWGVPLHDERRLLELLILEGAQAGLSWMTVLKKRERYRQVFDGFDPEKMARYNGRKIAALLADPGIIRNRLKVEAAIRNARAYLELAHQPGDFDRFLWKFVGGRPIRNHWRSGEQIPAETAESRAMSKELVRHGFTFVGPTICYAFMQAAGLVNDHVIECFRYAAC